MLQLGPGRSATPVHVLHSPVVGMNCSGVVHHGPIPSDLSLADPADIVELYQYFDDSSLVIIDSRSDSERDNAASWLS